MALLALALPACSELDRSTAPSDHGPAADLSASLSVSAPAKFLGNVWTSSQRSGWTGYWNQVTPENEGKWGSVQPNDPLTYNWTALDNTYNFAKSNGFPVRFHVLLWGNQQPAWIRLLPPDQQLAAIERWFAAVAARYPDLDYVEVVNEPLHDPPDAQHPSNQGANATSSGDYVRALGGYNDSDGTGWDWVLNAFRLARRHFPAHTRLVLNDYSITNSTASTQRYLEIIRILQAENLIDVIGVQGHAFETRGDMATHRANLDLLASTGLRLMITEMDIDGPSEEVQLADFRRIFPTFWSHPAVVGITMWGWRNGMWRTAQGATLVRSDGSRKLALEWLADYVRGVAPVVAPGQGFALDGGVRNQLGTVTATDWALRIGRPELRTFDWRITGGVGAEAFAIEPATGQLSIARPELLDLKRDSYTLAIAVNDGFHTSVPANVAITVPATVRICHLGDGGVEEVMYVARTGVGGHVQHGDVIGACGVAS